MKVLIVDDSALMRDRLLKMLNEKKLEISILEASDVEQARGILKTNLVELIILDIKMKGENGIELLREVKKTYPKIIVVMFTNYPYPQFSKKCWALGVDYFLEKSHDFEMIPGIIEKNLQK